MKKRRYLLLIFMLLCLTACTEAEGASPTEAWRRQARLDAEETPAQLYEAALLEETLVVYSHSTRLYDTKDAFEAAYPGLTVDVQFLRAVDIVELLRKGGQEGAYLCDVVVCTDASAAFTRDFVPAGLLHKYVPYDMAGSIRPEFNGDLLYFMVEGLQLFYNTGVYDSPPVTNWWELTEPRFYGKISMMDPIRSVSQFILLSTVIQQEEEMAAAYLELYGQPLEVPPGSTAGQVFWERLVANGVHFAATTDEVVDMVGLPGASRTPVGIVVSSKARRADIGYAVAPLFDVKPFSGVFSPASVSVSGHAKNINTAKLFIRFLLGEADGQGEGYRPYLQDGAWSVRFDVDSATETALEDTGFYFQDKGYYLENSGWIMDWWLALREQ